MKRLLNVGGSLLGLLASGVLVAVIVFAFGGLRRSAQSLPLAQSPVQTPAQPPYPPPVTPPAPFTPVPTFTPIPTPTPLPPIAWNPAPPCANQPQDVTAWRQYVATQAGNPTVAHRLAAYLRQAQPMSPALRDVTPDALPALLDTPDTAHGAEVIRRELAILWLNVMSGRLNRATEVNFPALSEVHTVGDLMAGLERALAEGRPPGPLMGASKQLQTGQGITRSVCARLLHLQIGNNLQEITWSADGLDKRLRLSQPMSADFPWGMGRLMPSPDYRWVAIETAGYEEAGPVYLLNTETGKLTKLDPMSALGDGKKLLYDGLPTWQVIGWHPDSQHLLVGPMDAGGVYWINLANNTFQVIPLVGSGGFGGRDRVDLSPDGNGFIYVSGYTDNSKNQRLDYYDLRSGKITTLLTFPLNEAGPRFPRFSPTGDSVAYLIEKIYPDRGYVIQLLDLKTLAKTTLFEGELGLSEFSWSPDGQMIALYRKDSSKSYVDIPSVGQLGHGNIWVVSVPAGEARQVTFIKGTAFRPTLSLDGRTLSFLTHDGYIGLTSLERPGVIWKAAASSADMPLFTSVFFLP